MCDCYSDFCDGCGCDMSIHIADFCTERENIHPFCNRCTRIIKKQKDRIKKSAKVFKDTITLSDQVPGGKMGEEVIILCDDPTAYGVHLN